MGWQNDFTNYQTQNLTFFRISGVGLDCFIICLSIFTFYSAIAIYLLQIDLVIGG
jgi:hypothetical protein